MLEPFKTRLRAAFARGGHFHVYGQADYAAQHARWFLNNCKGNIHCSQRRQPSYAAVERKGRILLHHEHMGTF